MCAFECHWHTSGIEEQSSFLLYKSDNETASLRLLNGSWNFVDRDCGFEITLGELIGFAL